MGKIIYKPHCGKCDAVIDQEVAYKKVNLFHHMSLQRYIDFMGTYIDIEPNRCTHCGNVFETIEIPMPREEK